jgi:hypothetical protein
MIGLDSITFFDTLFEQRFRDVVASYSCTWPSPFLGGETLAHDLVAIFFENVLQGTPNHSNSALMSIMMNPM